MSEKLSDDFWNAAKFSQRVGDPNMTRAIAEDYVTQLEAEFDKLVRYVRAKNKLMASGRVSEMWIEYDETLISLQEEAWQALSDETRKAIEDDPQN